MRRSELLRGAIRDIRLWGFGNFLFLYGLLSLYSNSIFEVQLSLPFLMVDLFPSGYALPMIVIFLVSCVVPGRYGGRFELLATVLFFIGLALLTWGVYSGVLDVLVLAVVLAVFAVGLSFTAAAWLRLLSTTAPKTVIIVVLAQGASAVAQIPLAPSLHPGVIATLVLASAALNGFLLRKGRLLFLKEGTDPSGHMSVASSALPPDTPPAMPPDTPPAAPSAFPSASLRILKGVLGGLAPHLLCIVAASLALAVSRTLAAHSLDAVEWGYPLPALGRIIAVVVLLFAWLVWKGPLRARVLTIGVLLAILIEYALYPLFGAHYAGAFFIFGHTLMTIVFILAVLASTELARTTSLPTLPMASAVFAGMYVFLTLGIAIAGVAQDGTRIEPLGLLLQAFAVVVVLALALLVMNITSSKERDSRRPVKTTSSTSVIGISEAELRANPTLTRHCQLSKREMDVLVLLLGARSVPFIAEALIISENTVRHHTKSIYQKLGVHNKQQLLNTVTEMSAGDKSRA